MNKDLFEELELNDDEEILEDTLEELSNGKGDDDDE